MNIIIKTLMILIILLGIIIGIVCLTSPEDFMLKPPEKIFIKEEPKCKHPQDRKLEALEKIADALESIKDKFEFESDWQTKK